MDLKDMNLSVKILGTGSYLPAKELSNDEIAKTLDTSDEWIYSHTGIHSRHIVADDETTSTMAVAASKAALEAANVSPDEIGLIVVATSTPDYCTFPSTGCLVQEALGCKNAGAYDLQAACSGIVYALEQASCWLMMHPKSKAIVVGSETLSRSVDWRDRNVCILFGDGAGAVVLGVEEYDGESMRSSSILGADGSGAHFIVHEGGFRKKLEGDTMPTPYMEMQGKQVFNFAVKTLDSVVTKLCTDAGFTPAALDRIYAHQANGRILEAVARRMDLDVSKFFMNLETTGNTSAASIPVALDQAVRAGILKDGHKICLVGFGAGLTYGGLLMQWPKL
jgi:3-oxoacyl-[acyl-carrier-protein] synthase-3